MITLHYYARFREKLGIEQESLELPPQDVTVQGLLDILASRGGIWQELFGCENVMVAIGQELTSRETAIYDEDDITLFPPISGG